jgi:hypothetical protein
MLKDIVLKKEFGLASYAFHIYNAEMLALL